MILLGEAARAVVEGLRARLANENDAGAVTRPSPGKGLTTAARTPSATRNERGDAGAPLVAAVGEEPGARRNKACGPMTAGEERPGDGEPAVIRGNRELGSLATINPVDERGSAGEPHRGSTRRINARREGGDDGADGEW